MNKLKPILILIFLINTIELYSQKDLTNDFEGTFKHISNEDTIYLQISYDKKRALLIDENESTKKWYREWYMVENLKDNVYLFRDRNGTEKAAYHYIKSEQNQKIIYELRFENGLKFFRIAQKEDAYVKTNYISLEKKYQENLKKQISTSYLNEIETEFKQDFYKMNNTFKAAENDKGYITSKSTLNLNLEIDSKNKQTFNSTIENGDRSISEKYSFTYYNLKFPIPKPHTVNVIKVNDFPLNTTFGSIDFHLIIRKGEKQLLLIDGKELAPNLKTEIEAFIARNDTLKKHQVYKIQYYSMTAGQMTKTDLKIMKTKFDGMGNYPFTTSRKIFTVLGRGLMVFGFLYGVGLLLEK